MSLEADTILGAIAIGTGTTLLTDLWNLLLKRAFSIPSLNYSHASITAAPAERHECTVGWIAHYTIGAIFAVVRRAHARRWLARPTVVPALLYGIGTAVFPVLPHAAVSRAGHRGVENDQSDAGQSQEPDDA